MSNSSPSKKPNPPNDGNQINSPQSPTLTQQSQPPRSPNLRPAAGQVIRGVGETRRPPGTGPSVPPPRSMPPTARPVAIIPESLKLSGSNAIKEVNIPQLQRRLDSTSSTSSVNIPSNKNARPPPARPIAPAIIPIASNSSNLSVKPANYIPPPLNSNASARPVIANSSSIRPVNVIPPQMNSITSSKPVMSNSSSSNVVSPMNREVPSTKPIVGNATASSKPGNYVPPPIDVVPKPRPLPPPIRPAGIPEDQPLPPSNMKDIETKAGRSIRPPPQVGKSKQQDKLSSVPAPSTEPPIKKGKKEKVIVVEHVPRRDRADPEFEDSDNDDDKQDFLERVVKQPKIPITDIKQIESLYNEAYETTPQKRIIDDEDEDIINKNKNVPYKLRDDIGFIRRDSAERSVVDSEVASIVPMQTQTFESMQMVDTKTEKLSNTSTDNNVVVKDIEHNNAYDEDDDHHEESDKKQVDNSAFTKRMTMLTKKEEEDRKKAIARANTIDSVANLIPPPPTNISIDVEQSKLAELLSRGRLSIRCLEGLNIRRKDDLQNYLKNDVFIKFKLGVAAGLPYKMTQTYKKQSNNPQFNDEIVYFDIVDPNLYIMNDDLQLVIEVYHKGGTLDECLGIVSMSVVRFFRQPYTIFEERVPLRYPDLSAITNSKLRLEFIFEEARSGMFVITLYEGKDLRIVDPTNRQDPYVEVQLSKNYENTSSLGKSNPFFNNEEIILWVDQNNWINDLYIYVLDNEYGHDKPIGFTHFCLLPYMNSRPDDAQADTFDLFYYDKINKFDEIQSEEKAQGTLEFQVTYLPAGKLTILVDKAKGLQFPYDYKPSSNTEVTRLDAYASISIEGKAVNMLKRTPVDKDGGNDPVWHSEIEFDIVDQYTAVVEIYHQGVNGVDILLGYSEFSLLQVFRNGHVDFWIALKQNKPKGGFLEMGHVYIDCKFSGLSGIAYPQYRPDIDSFDDTLRKILPPKSVKKIDEDDDVVIDARKPINTIPTEEDYANLHKPIIESDLPTEKPKIETEFTEEEIKAAFKFIDLNHNNFIGASEIRHILICMGELITDEEIDMMISLVDLDGDGQVSYQEFYAMVVTPNAEKVDLHKVIQKNIDDEILQEKMAIAGRTAGLDLKQYQRQKELSLKELKKKQLISFINDNSITFSQLYDAYTIEYIKLDINTKRLNNHINFNTFCELLNIEKINEYLKLFKLFDIEDNNTIDFREFILSSLNFINVEKDKRIKFSFQMFDENLNGTITRKDIEEILRGNHMINLTSVQRKADTIMKHISDQKQQLVTLNEFIIISKKFPNILFPTITMNHNSTKSAISL